MLDENIPVQLFRRLNEAGHDVEHIIVSGRRGMADSLITDRLTVEQDLVFLTQDTESLDLPSVVGVVPTGPSNPVAVDTWFSALEAFVRSPPPGSLQLMPTGELPGGRPPDGSGKPATVLPADQPALHLRLKLRPESDQIVVSGLRPLPLLAPTTAKEPGPPPAWVLPSTGTRGV